jgi:hypothetical protein
MAFASTTVHQHVDPSPCSAPVIRHPFGFFTEDSLEIA